MSQSSDKLSGFKVVNLTTSNYLKPLRVEFQMNNIKKYWDFLQVHDRLVLDSLPAFLCIINNCFIDNSNFFFHSSASILIFNRSRNVVVLVKQFRPCKYIIL